MHTHHGMSYMPMITWWHVRYVLFIQKTNLFLWYKVVVWTSLIIPMGTLELKEFNKFTNPVSPSFGYSCSFVILNITITFSSTNSHGLQPWAVWAVLVGTTEIFHSALALRCWTMSTSTPTLWSSWPHDPSSTQPISLRASRGIPSSIHYKPPHYLLSHAIHPPHNRSPRPSKGETWILLALWSPQPLFIHATEQHWSLLPFSSRGRLNPSLE